MTQQKGKAYRSELELFNKCVEIYNNSFHHGSFDVYTAMQEYAEWYATQEKDRQEGWISIDSGNLPELHELVNVCNDHERWVCSGHRAGKRWFNQYSEEEIIPTHWMPLPNPPHNQQCK